jgi:hypothetical protein
MPSTIFYTTEIAVYSRGHGTTASWQRLGTPVTGVEAAWAYGQHRRRPYQLDRLRRAGDNCRQ